MNYFFFEFNKTIKQVQKKLNLKIFFATTKIPIRKIMDLMVDKVTALKSRKIPIAQEI